MSQYLDKMQKSAARLHFFVYKPGKTVYTRYIR